MSPTAQQPQQSEQPNACNLCHLDESQAWTAEHLAEWYGQPRISIDREHTDFAAGLLWLVKGDAAQRAVVAAALARDGASETDKEWAVPILAVMLDDPYAVVRLLAVQAVQTIPGYEDFEADYIAPRDQRLTAKRGLMARWNARPHRPQPRVLIGNDGHWDHDTFEELLRERDDRSIYISE